MPLSKKIFDAQFRFVIPKELKDRLFREAKRRHLTAAVLLRQFVEDGLVKSERRFELAQKRKRKL